MMTRRTLFGLGAGAALGSLNLNAAAKVPRPAPELVVALNSGEQVLLSQFKGKLVVLEFLLTTCPHCQRCSSLMEKVHAELGPQAFQPLGAAVNPNDMTEARMLIPQYIAKLGLKFPVGWTKREMAYEWLGADQSAGPIYFPQLVFIDKKGIVRAQFDGTNDFFKNEEENMKNMIAEFSKGTPAAMSSAPKKAAPTK